MSERLSLWGGRFSDGPADALAALSKSTDFDWRLAQYDIAGSKAHALPSFTGRVCSPMMSSRGCSRRSTSSRAVSSRGSTSPPSPTRTSTPRSSVGSSRSRGRSSAESRGRAGRAMTRSRRWGGCTCAITLARSPASSSMPSTSSSPRPRSTPRRRCPGAPTSSTHSPCCSPTTCSRTRGRRRDVERLVDFDDRAGVSAYGSGALAGSSLGLDPQAVAADLGFADSVENSIDGTASRDVFAEYLFITAMIGIDLSRLSEEVIAWATKEFSFVTLHDAYSTGSSIMPQKKNPDVAELTRGKAGRLIGDLTGLLATLKAAAAGLQPRSAGGQRAGLRRDRHARAPALPAFTGMIATLKFDTERMAHLAPRGFALATDIAEWLVRRGVPFRVAHELSGACVQLAESRDVELWDLTDEDYAGISEHLTPEVREVLTTLGSIDSRDAKGGTARSAVAVQLESARAKVARPRTFAESPRSV